ncbi:MAG: hypothetical protein CMP23_05615 [Rickettsiales bacterium]|nr:hypothetical protein [Rickettsiales bacterium]
MTSIRVAAAQFTVDDDLSANLKRCLSAIDEAAAGGAQLVVLPEFCNHLSWYRDAEHCWEVSVDISGPWLGDLAASARQHQLHLVVNATVRREPGVITGTSLLYSPAGELLGQSDKQVLMGHENDFLRRAQAVCPVIETPIGRIGMYSCMDGVINETPRGLALRGAQILCNSLNSFAYDEGDLHVPVRAPENRTWVVAANKVGPLIPEYLLEEVSRITNIPVVHLFGAGDSQVVAPDGTVITRADRQTPGVVFADIEPQRADDKTRPDGTDVFASRRPELYAAIAQAPARADLPPGAPEVRAAVYQPESSGQQAIIEVAAVLRSLDPEVSLLVLPELFCFEGAAMNLELAEAEARSQAALERLVGSCREGVAVVTSLLINGRNTGVVLSRSGVLLRQAQLHPCARLGEEHAVGQQMEVLQLAWGRLAVVVGDDALYPETFRLAALAGAEVVAAPIHVIEAWEVETGLPERAAENRLSLVYATRTEVGTSAILGLPTDFTLMTPWESRLFDGNISTPLTVQALPNPGLTIGNVHPAAATNKMVSANTNVLDGRPWHLAEAITTT